MNLLFFGSSDRQLFGAYHAPVARVPARGAAVLCPPWGQEYIVCHRTLRRLATRLSERGFHVLRFDYYGTGDSAGEREEGDLSSWYADAELAVDELRDMSGQSNVACIGVRLGAVVAWRLGMNRPDVSTVVMWDPVVDGADYVDELIEGQVEFARWSLSTRETYQEPDGTLDLLGFPLTPLMRQSIGSVEPVDFGRAIPAQVRLFYSDVLPGRADLLRAFELAGTTYHSETIAGQMPWHDETNGAAGLPVDLIERIVEMMP